MLRSHVGSEMCIRDSLKTSHVNKTAQEQFKFRFYTKEFVISSFKPLTFFLILKKVNNLSFTGMNLKVKSLFKRNEKKKIITDINTIHIQTNKKKCLL